MSRKTYMVYGSTGEEVLAYIENYGPLDDKGQRASGVTDYSASLEWRSNGGNRGCSIESMTIKVDLEVVLPELAVPQRLPAAALGRWTEFAAGVAAHEQRHVEIYLSGAETLKERMAAIPPASTCAGLEASVDAAWKAQQEATDAAQDAFHAEERQRIEALRAPLRAQIDAARAQLASLQRQIAAIDTNLGSISGQIGPLRNLLESIQAQIGAIESRYQGQSVPPDVFQQYDSLRNQYNSLIPSYNALIQQYNAEGDRRAGLLRQAHVLQDQANELVDRYNWTR